jgi:selenocysteine lyase/cysteine desulfurase
MNKRTFIKSFSLLGMTPAFRHIDKWIKRYQDVQPETLASNEDFWEAIRSGYRLKPDYINLENGYYCFMPEEILEQFIKNVREVNYQGSYYMRNRRVKDNGIMAEKLASVAGCSKEELIITRNATESLDLVIGGTHWEKGDEAVMAEQDYGAMLDMFRLVGKKYGVVNRIVSVPNHPSSDEEIVALYESAITSRTKLLMVSHMINITGQILPVQKICSMAHSRGVKVLVDGAHAFAHISFAIPELQCDYYGTSLHKWLSVPLGCGFLYVKKDNVADLWPLLADNPRLEDDNILRLSHTGTNPVHTNLTISCALDYYMKVGSKRKEDRLRYLQRYWTEQVKNLENVLINTPAEKERSCGIANVGVKNMKPAELAERLMKKYRIFTVAIDTAGVQGCRITPNIYTTPEDLDQLVHALKDLSDPSSAG